MSTTGPSDARQPPPLSPTVSSSAQAAGGPDRTSQPSGQQAMTRATLRVYLGYAAGVGKTFAMLAEGRRQRERGVDLVVGFVEPHGRAPVLGQLDKLEVTPLRRVAYRGRLFEEMDVDAILQRRPQVALVDELAHANIPGSRNQYRWQDVAELLDAGITVVSTLNVQHLESLHDIVERITNTKQRTTIPDRVLAAAEVELVDLPPWALRRRLADGEIFPADRVDAALANYFQEHNLTALRELALSWLAGRMDDALRAQLPQRAGTGAWETHERVVVALSGRADGDRVIRRAARLAANRHGELLAVHVVTGGQLADDAGALVRQQQLVTELGGTLHEVTAKDVPGGLLAFARAERATLLVVGASTSSWWRRLLNGSVLNRIVRAAGHIDVHVVPLDRAGAPTGRLAPPRARSLPPRRRIAGLALAAVGLPTLTSLLLHLRDRANLSSVLLAYLALVVAVATVGGSWAAVLAALAASALGNYYFTQPFNTWRISDADNVVALVVFLAVAVVVSTLVAVAERRRHQAERGRSEAEALARLAGSLLREPDPVPSLLHHLQSTFSQRAVAVLTRKDGQWHVDAAVGPPPLDPERATESIPLGAGDEALLALDGPRLAAADRRVLSACAALLSVAVHRRQLSQQVDRIAEQEAGNELRRAILDAVSHDLRTPLASIKAAVTGLRETDTDTSSQVTTESLALIEEETDRLNRLVGNLLDMSRIQAGAVTLARSAIGFDEVVPRALASLPRHGGLLTLDVPESLPRVHADPALLERAVANVIANALAWSPATTPVRVHASAVGRRVELRVTDHGPGVPAEQRHAVLEPFRRLGDRSHGAGVGLGLAVAKGFVDAMDGRLLLEDTPGGGLTVAISLEAAG
jgi:two-component system sensor histidine kinase KdpD